MGRKNKKHRVIHKNTKLFSLLKRKERVRIQSHPHLDIAPHDKAYIYQSEISFIGKCILDYPNIETGGQLFGYWTASGAPVVVYAIGPGPNANHQVAFFNQDVNYLERVGKMLVSQFGLMHIGEWHSHHRLGLDHPSGHDANTMQSTIDRRHLNRFLLCIGNCRSNQFSIKPYNFLEGHSSFVNSNWVIKGEESPLRSLIDSQLEKALMQNRSIAEQDDIKETWFEKRENRIQLKSMLDYLSSSSQTVSAKLDGKTVQILADFHDRNELISFPADFPLSPISVVITYPNGTSRTANATSESCNKGNDVYEAFLEQYKSITI